MRNPMAWVYSKRESTRKANGEIPFRRFRVMEPRRFEAIRAQKGYTLVLLSYRIVAHA